ncbi:MAG: 4Fe-4S dicluster domain-containing protein [Deltaproteobacteria bacterium]|nr:4Fe-4S dicluster domain-containing protein [Deltaproteobacteria bacterium]MBW2307141.1 4Fe-4S dicluster domain-containing protein [Deltaproteobacteria bacterium]
MGKIQLTFGHLKGLKSTVTIEATNKSTETISEDKDRKVVLVDVSTCIACRACQVACKRWNELPAEQTRNMGTYQNPPDLSILTYTYVNFQESENGKPEWYFRKIQCMHCNEPGCMDACPVEAIYKTSTGAVVVDLNKCEGHGDCREGCPYDIPRIDKEAKKMYKCTFCLDRLVEGMPPACMAMCTTGALQFGSRPEMYEKAQLLKGDLKKRGLSKADVYGPGEMGGTHWIYVLPKEPELFKYTVASLEKNHMMRSLARKWSGFGMGAALLAGLTKASRIED